MSVLCNSTTGICFHTLVNLVTEYRCEPEEDQCRFHGNIQSGMRKQVMFPDKSSLHEVFKEEAEVCVCGGGHLTEKRV